MPMFGPPERFWSTPDVKNNSIVRVLLEYCESGGINRRECYYKLGVMNRFGNFHGAKCAAVIGSLNCNRKF